MTSLLEASETFQITVKKFDPAAQEAADGSVGQAMIKHFYASYSVSLKLWKAATSKSLKSARKHSINVAFFDKLLFSMLIPFYTAGSFRHLKNISWQALLPHFARITNLPARPKKRLRRR